jgi:hypothetical protein
LEWGSVRFDRDRFDEDAYAAEIVGVQGLSVRDLKKCNDCEYIQSASGLERYERSARDKTETYDALSPEEARAKLLDAYNRVADAMDVAWEEGELTPESIRTAIIEFRRDHPYHDE